VPWSEKFWPREKVNMLTESSPLITYSQNVFAFLFLQ
jgi:hypothetical protein